MIFRNITNKLFNHIEITLKINYLIKSIVILIIIDCINSNDCFISNSTTIISQWLNNIICLGDQGLKYINIATYSNQSLIVEATSNPDSPYRVFYGIKKNGEPFFNDSQYHFQIKISGQTQANNARYEAEIFIVEIDNKEYLLSIGAGTNKYAELYDLSTGEIISQVLSKTFLGVSEISNTRGSATNFISSEETYIIFSFLNSEPDLYIKKLYFTSTDIVNNNPVIKTYTTDSKGKAVSCYVTESNYVVCLFLQKDQVIWFYYFIGIYDLNLSRKSETRTEYYAVESLLSSTFDYFLKCFLLEGNIGVFIFYNAIKTSTVPLNYDMETFPTIIFKKLTGTSLSDYLSEIKLNQKTFIDSSLLNDFIKMSNTKLCFISTSTSKEDLYVVLIKIFNTNKIVIRYYTIDIYTKYNFKFLEDMRAHLFDKYISFAFSFCRQSSCSSESDTHYAGFLVFNYPNGTDYDFNLVDDIIEKNKIDDLIIDLNKYVRIDNNIFGLVYSAIIIKEINNCDNISFFSTVKENTNISINYNLTKNENINVTFNSYNAVNCSINYNYIITEPEFSVYNTYAERFTTYGEDTEDIFKADIKEYESRILKYKIIIEDNLVKECQDINCNLCLEHKRDYCLICKYNYRINNDGINKNKICYPNQTETIETTIINIDTTQLFETQIMKDSTQKIEITELVDSTIKEDYIGTTQITEMTELAYTTQMIEMTDLDSTYKDFRTYTTQITHSTGKINIDTTEQINNPKAENTEKKQQSDTIKETKMEDNASKTCTNDEILNNSCGNGEMTNEQVKEVYNSLIENLLSEDYKGENTIIETENVIFQVSTLDDQKNNINPNVSTIDLGECENILKSKYNVSEDDSLIVIKTDIKNEDKSSTYVQYEIYHPITKEQLNLNYCSDVTITVNVPVHLDDSTASLYESLSESGYNLFDSEDDFYNDVCSTYTSQNGTDMTLLDRQNEIYTAVENISMCQTGCKFESYNKTTQKAKCNCEVQINSTETDISKIDFSSSSIVSSFITTLTNSNFLVLKCYKLVLTIKNILKNKGRIIMTIIYFCFLICLLFYIIKERTKIHKFINLILKNKKNDNGLNKIKLNKKNEVININKKLDIGKSKEIKMNEKTGKELELNKNKKIKDNKNKKNKNKDNKSEENKKMKENKNKNKDNKNKDNKNKDNKKIKEDKTNKKKNKSKDKNNSKEKIKKKSKRTNTKEPPKKRGLNNKIKNKENININSTFKTFTTDANLKTPKKHNKININIIPIHNINYGKIQKKKEKEKNRNSREITTYRNDKRTSIPNYKNVNDFNVNLKNLNDQELNTLDYEIAIIIDKRTYFQYYWSLLKKKQLILFTILPANDYNLYTLKLSLFLLSFSLYFTINGFFFSDDTMHKIHKDNGAFNIIYQIPQILYSSVVSAVINMILKMLSLSEKNILVIKQEKDIKIATKKSKSIESCIIIKFIIFFILSNILLLFFWYFISCFCAVYTNTQMILIEDTLISFALSMAYPFGLNLLPGIFRIPALRAKYRDKKLLYKISGLVALI